LPFRRTDVTRLAVALVAVVFALDLLWALAEGSTGSLGYGLLDEPSHLATCGVLLLAVAASAALRLPARFVVAALLASVMIDLDHLPRYLGWSGLSGSLPRPYSHCLLLVLAFLLFAWATTRRDIRQIALGVALGLGAHLLRDVATGPGVPLGWPFTDDVVRLPYAFYATTMVLAVAYVATPRRALATRLGLPVALIALLLSAAAAAPKPAAARSVSIGAYISGADNSPGLIDDFDTQVGRPVSTLLSYKDWGQQPFVHKQLNGIWEHGAVPMITWEPWGASLKGIARGDYDAYIHEAAVSAATWNKPLMVRFGQEMNGGWFPWGGHPEAYKAAWRHLVRVFRRAGASKVRWVWTPYVNSDGGRLSFAPYYPGGRWIDWAGLDALNWGGPFPWRTFVEIIGSSYRELVDLTDKPLIVAETGSGEQGGDKAHWLSSMLRCNIPRMKHVRAIAFWSADDERGDLRVDSSPAALEAVRNALSRPLYGSSRFGLLRTPARIGR
jgi:mannan endo-1,4-beta-mannosidase